MFADVLNMCAVVDGWIVEGGGELIEVRLYHRLYQVRPSFEVTQVT